MASYIDDIDIQLMLDFIYDKDFDIKDFLMQREPLE